jgi:hypothetical protein
MLNSKQQVCPSKKLLHTKTRTLPSEAAFFSTSIKVVKQGKELERKSNRALSNALHSLIPALVPLHASSLE